jgi:cytochrome c-type biogenesis protein CcmH/NrfG
MSAAQFDKALRNYVGSGHYKYFPIPTSSISSTGYTATPLTQAGGNAVLADIHLHSPDYRDRALTEFQEILKSDPKNAAACRGLGYAYLQKQDFTQAAQYFGRASQLDSKDPRVHYYSALLMARQGGFGSGADLPAMTKELENSISLDPNFADSYALLAFAQSTSGDAAKALVTMRKALAISPRDQNYWFNLANIYLSNRQPDQAIAVLQSLQVNDNPELASRVAAMLAQARQFAEMMKSGPQIGQTIIVSRRDEPKGEPASYGAAPVPSGVSKFLKGMLTNADCGTPPSVLLTVVAGAKTWKMKVADRNHLILIGADQFSCSWSKQKVAVNYRETAEGEANVVSLEIQ